MKCTNCSAHIRPIVTFDIDGTLGDYHSHFVRFCTRYFGRKFPEGYNGYQDFEEHLGLSRPDYRAAKLAYRQGGTKRWMPAFPGAKTVVEETKRLGAEVWVATTRPWQRLDNIDPDTREWLHRNELHVDGLLFGEDKYCQLIETVDQERVVGCVEDLADQFDMAAELKLPVYQVARQHNSYPGVMRYPRGTLVDAGVWIVNNIELWTKEHSA